MNADELLEDIEAITRILCEEKVQVIKEYVHQAERRGFDSRRKKQGIKSLRAECGEMLHEGIMGLLAKRAQDASKDD